MPERILVAGCGAVGSVFAALLCEHGCEVDVLGRGEHLAEVARSGVRIDGIWGEHHARPAVAVTTPSQLTGSYDAILVCCKSYQTEALLGSLQESGVLSRGVAVSLQNGIGNWEKLAAVLGSPRALAGRVIFGAEIMKAGSVRVTVEAEPVLIGHPDGPYARAEYWATVFQAAGINARATDNILAALWGKVFYNAALNPMGALLGLRYGELAADPLRRQVMDRVIAEAFAVARAEGVAMPWATDAEYRRHFHLNLVPPTAGHRSSMLQDLERGRATEIQAICGEVCRRGDAAGVDVSVNRALLALVSGRGG